MSSFGEGGTQIGPYVRLRDDGIYLMDFGLTPVTDADLDAHFEEFGRFCDDNRAPLGGVVILRSLTSGTASQRKRMAEFEVRVERHDEEHMVACAIVAPSQIARGLATAVFWLKPPVYPYRFFAELEPALDWVLERMAESS